MAIMITTQVIVACVIVGSMPANAIVMSFVSDMEIAVRIISVSAIFTCQVVEIIAGKRSNIAIATRIVRITTIAAVISKSFVPPFPGTDQLYGPLVNIPTSTTISIGTIHLPANQKKKVTPEIRMNGLTANRNGL